MLARVRAAVVSPDPHEIPAELPQLIAAIGGNARARSLVRRALQIAGRGRRFKSAAQAISWGRSAIRELECEDFGIDVTAGELERATLLRFYPIFHLPSNGQ